MAVSVGTSVTILFLFVVMDAIRPGISQNPSATIPFTFITSSASSHNTSGVQPAIEIAVELIGSESIELQYTTRDSMCDGVTALHEVFEDIQSRVPVGVVGCGCTNATLPVAETIHHLNSSLVSYASSSREFQDRRRYPNYFQVHPRAENLALGLAALLKEFAWKRVGIISDKTSRFLDVYETIQQVFQEGKLNLTAKNFPFKAGSELELGFEEDYRVFFVNMFSLEARLLMCQILTVNLNLTSPRYAWIVYGWYERDWWLEDVTLPSSDTHCTSSELAAFLSAARTLAIQPFPSPSIDATTIAGGISSGSYSRQYTESIADQSHRYVPEHIFAYDAVWSLFYAISKTVQLSNSSLSPEDVFLATGCHVNVSTNEMDSCIIRKSLQETSFIGASGHVEFDELGIRVYNKVALYQYRNNSRKQLALVPFGAVDITSGKLTYEERENQATVFPSAIPLDGTPVRIVMTFNLAVVGVAYALATVGMAFAIVCLVFNLAFRKRKVVRLTSPNLNYFIILGGVCAYASVYLYALPTVSGETYRIRCILLTSIASIGYTMAFGTILGKMYRIYQIFHNPAPNKMVLKDRHICIIIFVVVGVGLLMLIIRYSIPILRPVATLRSNRERPQGFNDLGVMELYFSWRCNGQDPEPVYWQLVFYSYLLILELFALFLAFLTRTVKIKVLNDYKWISLITYTSFVVLFLFLLFTLALSVFINASALVYSVGVFIATTSFLGFVFIPKMVSLCKDPKGERIFEHTNPAIHNRSSHDSFDRAQTTSMVLPLSPLGPRVRRTDTMQTVLPEREEPQEPTMAAAAPGGRGRGRDVHDTV